MSESTRRPGRPNKEGGPDPTISLRLPAALLAATDERATIDSCTRTDVIQRAITAYLASPGGRWELETDATRQRLGELASFILGRDAHPSTTDGGRLGCFLVGSHADLERVRAALVGSGYEAWLEQST